MIFLVAPMAMALDFDNRGDYSEGDKKITITNNFGFGSTIAEIELITPRVNKVFKGKDRRVMVFEVNNLKNLYGNGLKKMEILDLNKGGSINNGKSFHYEYAVYETVDVEDLEYVCINGKTLGNGTIEKTCSHEVKEIRSVTRIKEWKTFNGKDLPSGKTLIALVTDVESRDYYDGIPTLFGVRVDRWAVWEESFDEGLVAYWTMNESSGTNAVERIYGVLNFTTTNSPAWVSGQIGNALNFSNQADQTAITISAVGNGITGNNPWTVNTWTTPTYSGGDGRAWIEIGNQGAGQYVSFARDGGSGNYQIVPQGNINYIESDDNGLKMHTIHYNGSYMNWSINGTWVGGIADNNINLADSTILLGNTLVTTDREYDGWIDELSIWNRTLSQEEITNLYNGGAGITYSPPEPPPLPYNISVINTNPTNALITTNASYDFNATLIPLDVNFTNYTVELYYSNDTLINRTTATQTGNITVGVETIFYNLPIASMYWFYNACGLNDTSGTVCGQSPSNFTFTRQQFTPDNIFYENATYETKTNNFQINLTTVAGITVVSGDLIYNNTIYPATVEAISSSKFSITRALEIPLITETSTTQTNEFNFTFSYLDSGDLITARSDTINHEVGYINASLLSAPLAVSYINFTIYEQNNLSKVNAAVGATFNYGINNTAKSMSYENLAEDTNTYEFAFLPPNQTFYSDATLSFSKTGYVTQIYSLQETLMQNITNGVTEVPIYLIESQNSTTFTIYVRDSSFVSLVGATVEVERFYPGLGEYAVTESLITNSDGKAFGHFVSEEIIYRFKVYVNGNLELTSVPTKIVCETSPCTITLTLPQALAGEFGNYGGTVSDFTSSLTYDKTTYVITYTYTDLDTTVAEGGKLHVRRITNTGDVAVCSNNNSASAASITCDLTNEINGTYIANGYLERSNIPSRIIESITVLKERDIVGTLGIDGVLIAVFMFMGIIMLGLFKPVLAIAFGTIGVIIMWAMQLISITWIALISIICMAIIIAWEMRK